MKHIQERVLEVGRRVAKSKVVTPTPPVPVIERRVEFPELLSMEKLLSMQFPESRWAVDKLVPHQGITILSGPPGNFKTWLLLLMGISMAKGEKFLGQFECIKSSVLIVDEEDHPRLLQERANLLGATSDSPIYFLSQQGVAVDKETWIKRILSMCERNNIDTIFFDSLVRIHSGNENDATQMSVVFKELKKFCQNGKTVVLTHHERKEGLIRSSAQNKMRGSSDISAAVDSHISVRKDRDMKGVLVFEQPKLRGDEETPAFEIVVVKEEAKVSFMYSGNHSGEAEKASQIKETILHILTESEEKLPMMVIVDQVKVVEEVGGKFVQKILKDMIENKVVGCEKGKKNAKLCFLPSSTEVAHETV